jgi:hypothetical protein
MESNGAPERIHISEQTAEKLREAGKGDWFVPRQEKIIAKGEPMPCLMFEDQYTFA